MSVGDWSVSPFESPIRRITAMLSTVNSTYPSPARIAFVETPPP